MKHNHLFVLALAAVMAFVGVSCEKSPVEEPEAPVLTLAKTADSVAADATSYDLSVESNCDWTATASEGVSVDPAKGNGDATVSLAFAANAAYEPVTYTVTFAAKGVESKTFTLTQAAAEKPAPVLTVAESAEVAADATTYELAVESNYPWTATASEGVTLEPAAGEGNGTVVLTFAANEAYEAVTYTVTFAVEGLDPKTFTLTQAAAEPKGPAQVTVAEFLAAVVGDTEYQLTGVMTGTYNTTYGNFYLEDATGKVLVYGLTATKKSSNDKSFASLGLRDGDTVTLVGTRDDYNGTAQVGGPAYYVSHIAAPYVDFTVGSVTVDAEATSYSIAFESNVAWTATASEGVTLEPASGEGNGTVVATFAANASNDPLDHTVTFTAEGLTKTFTITQKGVPSGDAEPRYVKVTEAQADWSGKYLIVFGSNAHATLSGKDLNATKAVTITAGEIEATSDLDAAVMTVTKNGDKYVMKYPDGKYFSMAKNASSSSTTAFDLTFTYTASGVKIAGVASGTTYILYHNGSNGNYYRCYVDKNGQSGYNLPTLYKYTE